MSKIVFIILFVFFAASSALAQSANSKPNDWSGFYAGGNGFASSDNADAAATLNIQQITNLFVTGRGIVVIPGTTRPFAASRRKTNGGGGFQAGYQWQTGRFVFGGEGDFNPFHRTASVSQSFQIPPTLLEPIKTINARRDTRLSREFSLRGRAGVAFGNSLVYGTGGYSNVRAKVSYIDSYTNPGGITPPNCGPQPNVCFNSGPEGPVIITASQSKNMRGWNVGGGFEQKFGKRFSIGFEYRHTDLRSKTFSPTNGTVVNTGPETHGDANGFGGSGLGATGLVGFVSSGPTRVSLKSDSFGVRVNFHF
ncbi:MAG: outer membrane protein [Pyrinomonadaceae bacterium]